jgi:hypothetical protein
VLAEEMAESAMTLQRPMAKLRTEGRVRSVGERHMMRYFPAVVRAASAKDDQATPSVPTSRGAVVLQM